MKKLYLSLLFALAFFGLNAQCMLYPVSLNQRVSNSSLIVEGEVMSKQSYWNAEHNNIFTSNLVRITQTLKGSVNSSFLEIITKGGQVGNDLLVVEPSLQLNLNEKGIFLLNNFEIISQFGYAMYETYSDQQGFIKFNEDGTAKDPFTTYNSSNVDLRNALTSELNKYIPVFNAPSGGTKNISSMTAFMPITGFSPASITAGTASQLTITGSGFGMTQGASVVRFANADQGGWPNFITPHASQYVSWSDTQIRVQVPTRTGGSGTAGTGSIQVIVGGSTLSTVSTLTITHGQLNVLYTNTVNPQQIFNTRHHGTNGAGGMSWRMNTAFDGSVAPKADFQTALGKWRCATFINWQIGPTVATTTVAGDGINVVGFDNVVLPTLGAGILGVCTSWFQACISGSNIAWYLAEHDIVFDNAPPGGWSYGGVVPGGAQYDFESVVLHELGHGHQLSHVVNTSEVMHYALNAGATPTLLSGNTVAGGNAVMTRNLSGAVCGQNIMVALNGGNCALAAPSASFNLAGPVCVGQAITLTDNSTNVPNQWLWTMTGGAPATATTQNATTSYATPGVKTITLQATNGVGSSSTTRTINVIPSPTLAVTSASICGGGSAVLTASGTTSYTWNPGGLTGASQTLSPGSTTTYTVIGSNGTCTNSAMGTLTVDPIPNIIAFQSSTAICQGETATITIGGATNYTTNPGGATGTLVTVSPSITTTYTITGNNGTSCAGTKTLTLIVNICTAFGELQTLGDLQVYPNPAHDQLQISFGTNFTGEIEITNILGQIIDRSSIENSMNETISVNEMAKGIYMIKISDRNENTRIIKIVID